MYNNVRIMVNKVVHSSDVVDIYIYIYIYINAYYSKACIYLL